MATDTKLTDAELALDEMFGEGSAMEMRAQREAESAVTAEELPGARKYAVSTSDPSDIRRVSIDTLLGLDMEEYSTGVYVIFITGIPVDLDDVAVIAECGPIVATYTTTCY